MNINYKRLFNLAIAHNYFKDGCDRFVHLSPTRETENLLKNGRMLFKRLANGVTVLYRAKDKENTPFVELDADQRFSFVIATDKVVEMLNVTGLNDSAGRRYSGPKILYFRNDPGKASNHSGNPEIITHELLDSLRGQLFTYSFTLDGNPTNVLMRVSDRDGNPVSIGKETDGTAFPTTLELSVDSDSAFIQQVDLRFKPKGRYTITIWDETGTSILKVENIYVDDLLTKQNVLGIVDILYDTATNHLYGETEEYELNFCRAATYWRYFVVNKSQNIDFSSDSLVIKDLGVVNGSPYSQNDFVRICASIELTALDSGTSGNSIELGYSGGGEHRAISLSGKTLADGKEGVKARGTLTLINNDVTDYTVSINGIDFMEGIDFRRGESPSETVLALEAAILANEKASVSVEKLGYDILVQGFQTLVFRSTKAIPFFEYPKLNVELQQASDNQTIVANLPNPSRHEIRKEFAGQLESEVYIFI
jgi:hypothetical protein